ncbi:MAG: glycosyltransferase [Planctomycetota bacterium]
MDAEISRVHCRIAFEDGQWTVEDQGSLNGTILNGEKIERATLGQGDRLHLGNTTMRFDIIGAPPAEPEAPPPEKVCPKCGAEIPAGAASCPVCDTARVAAAPAAEPAARPERRFQPPSVVRVEKEETIRAFLEKHPDDTSNIVLSLRQKIWYPLVLAALIFLFIADYLYFFLFVHVVCIFYLLVIGYKLVSIFLAVLWRWDIRVPERQIAELNDDELPTYTVFVPLYREPEVANKIVRHIAAMDYPKDKLDVKILLEPDDPQTLEAVRESGLPAFCEVIICPDSQPRTKPKACNHGLARATGEYSVIYDAEDRPEPDQLKKAVIGFRKAEQRFEARRRLRRWNPFQREKRGRTVCLQAKLNYYNPTQNLLTRFFMIEYSTWFELYLPGLHALRAPIPLGGTSNHFRTDVLREIGGWDPFNVTEDCDLGIRLHKMGYRTQVIDSTTWEEANSRVGNWIRQRSRWVKGYVQTHLTHMRRPLRTLWRLRPWGMFNFLNAVGGLSLMLLLNPIFWVVLALYVGLFTADLAEHDWSLERAIGIRQAIADASDVTHIETLDRTIRLPHPSRRAWPMVCTGWRMDTPPDASWQEVLRRGVGRDWNVFLDAAPSLWSGEGPPPTEETQRIEPVGPEPGAPAARAGSHAAWRQLWGSRAFHLWNVVSQTLFLVTLLLVLGNVFFVAVHVVACFRAGRPKLAGFGLLMPFYWVLISIAAWKGFFQLFTRPFYWEKTQHGLDKGFPQSA